MHNSFLLRHGTSPYQLGKFMTVLANADDIVLWISTLRVSNSHTEWFGLICSQISQERNSLMTCRRQQSDVTLRLSASFTVTSSGDAAPLWKRVFRNQKLSPEGRAERSLWHAAMWGWNELALKVAQAVSLFARLVCGSSCLSLAFQNRTTKDPSRDVRTDFDGEALGVCRLRLENFSF